MLQKVRPRLPAFVAAFGTGRAWIAAAVLVLVGATATGLWLTHTGQNADQDRLERGAAAIGRNIESELKTISMVSAGAEALFGGAETPEDFASLTMAVDVSILNSIVGLVSYPVTDDGIVGGDLVLPIRTWEDIVVPDLPLSKASLDDILADNPAHLSAAYTEYGKDDIRMIALVPVEGAGQTRMVGAIILVDRMLERAVNGVADGEYAATLVDTRFDDRLITSTGPSSGDLSVRISPTGLAGLLVADVTPGTAFQFESSAWILIISVAVGITVALLLLGLAVVTRARTEEFEQRLSHSQEQHESRDRFLATVSHELRTPLTAVMGVASEMNQQWATMEDDERQELFAMISEQAEEASNIVEDLLVAARSEYGDVQIAMKETQLQGHLLYAAESVPPSHRAGFTMTGENPVVYADTTRLRQVLRNLLQNAVNHGGPNISVTTGQSDDMVHVSVIDDGAGISDEDQERVFDQYAQAHGTANSAVQGIGIGLYVSRLLARLMGGDLIYLRSNDQTEFRFMLQAASSPGQERPRPDSSDLEQREFISVG